MQFVTMNVQNISYLNILTRKKVKKHLFVLNKCTTFVGISIWS